MNAAKKIKLGAQILGKKVEVNLIYADKGKDLGWALGVESANTTNST